MHIVNCVIRMLPAVDFDQKFWLKAYKVGNVSINWTLANAPIDVIRLEPMFSVPKAFQVPPVNVPDDI